MKKCILNENPLDIQFRAAMEIPLLPKNEARLRDAMQPLMGNLLARHDLCQEGHLQSMLLACRLRLRALQNTLLCTRAAAGCAFCRCEVRELTADVCAAADLLLHPLGRTVRFEAAETPMDAVVAPREFLWLVLELLCNAARHCNGEEILLRLEQKPRHRRRPGAVVLNVACEGALDLNTLHAACARPGAGAAALLQTARLHGAPLLWLEREQRVCAALRLPGVGTGPCKPSAACHSLPDYVELLNDPFSPVYTALAPVTGVGICGAA
jgi:hypothetical protein